MRRCTLTLLYEGKDISADIGPDLLSFTFTDKSGSKGEADDVQIVISDRDKQWQGPWLPRRGHVLRPVIRCVNWFEDGDSLALNCGTFQVDEVEFEAGEVDKITIKGIPSAVKSSIAGQKKTRAWNGTNLRQIAGDIAGQAGLGLVYKAGAIPFERVEQRQEPDLAFLHRVAADNGCRVKVAEDKIIVYSGAGADGLAPVTLTRRDGDSFRARIATAEVYSDCVVSFTNPKDGKLYQYTYKPTDAPKTGKVLTVNKRAENVQAAQRMAQAALRAKNGGQMTGDWSGMGDPRLRAGGTVRVSGFGGFDAAYSIKEATHTVTAEKYVTGVSLEAALVY